MINNLPVENQIVRDARYLQHGRKESKHGSKAISRLGLVVGKALGPNMTEKYFGNGIKTRFDLSDKVKSEYELYQLEKIPESFIKNPEQDVPSKSRQQHSYWVEAYGLVGVDLSSASNMSIYRRCDEYWYQVS